MSTDPGLDGVVPFRFACHRCGHCCSGGQGHVWLEPGEVEAMAAARSTAVDTFRARHVRTVRDPATGVLRESLREADEGSGSGRCSLLEGTNTCSVYTARPAHCRTFPYWPGVLADEAAFERARSTCPGIAVEVDQATRARAFAALEALYGEVDAFVARSRAVCIVRGVCCRFEEAGHELFATALEADYAAARRPDAPPPEAPGRCPYHVAGRCTAREARPLGCRTYFCDANTTSVLAEAHEHFLARIRALERELGYPAAYGRFPALLDARGVGRAPAADGDDGDDGARGDDARPA
jgi:Fe-S-cluster containining protein